MMTRSDSEPVRRDARCFRLLVARDFENRVISEGLVDAAGFDAIMSTARRVAGGRGTHRILESCGDPIRFRPSRRGGFLARWLGDRYLTPARPFHEFRVSTTLRQRGLSLPTPALAVSRRRGLFWRSGFASVDRVDAIDGVGWLATRPCRRQLRLACIAFASALRRFHED